MRPAWGCPASTGWRSRRRASCACGASCASSCGASCAWRCGRCSSPRTRPAPGRPGRSGRSHPPGTGLPAGPTSTRPHTTANITLRNNLDNIGTSIDLPHPNKTKRTFSVCQSNTPDADAPTRPPQAHRGAARRVARCRRDRAPPAPLGRQPGAPAGAARVRRGHRAAPGRRPVHPPGLRRDEHGRPGRRAGPDQVGDLPPRAEQGGAPLGGTGRGPRRAGVGDRRRGRRLVRYRLRTAAKRCAPISRGAGRPPARGDAPAARARQQHHRGRCTRAQAPARREARRTRAGGRGRGLPARRPGSRADQPPALRHRQLPRRVVPPRRPPRPHPPRRRARGPHLRGAARGSDSPGRSGPCEGSGRAHSSWTTGSVDRSSGSGRGTPRSPPRRRGGSP